MSSFYPRSHALKVLYPSLVVALFLAGNLRTKTFGAEISAEVIQTHRQKLAEARTFALAKDSAGVEAALVAMCRAVPNSDDWNIEAAQRIVQFVESERKGGRIDLDHELLLRATQKLTLVERRAADPAVKARALSFLGFVLERQLGNHKGALAAHRAALELAPAQSAASKQAVERLERSSAVEGTIAVSEK